MTAIDLECRWCRSQAWWVAATATLDADTGVVTIPAGGLTCRDCGQPWSGT